LHDPARATDPRVTGLDRLLALAATVTPEVAAEIVDISAGEIRALADRIRRSRATAFHMSVGVNQGPFGTLSYVALQALAFLTGNFDREGGVLFHPLAGRVADALRVAGVGTET